MFFRHRLIKKGDSVSVVFLFFMLWSLLYIASYVSVRLYFANYTLSGALPSGVSASASKSHILCVIALLFRRRCFFTLKTGRSILMEICAGIPITAEMDPFPPDGRLILQLPENPHILYENVSVILSTA